VLLADLCAKFLLQSSREEGVGHDSFIMKGFLQWAEMQNGANSYSQALLTVLEDFSKFCFKLKD